MAAHPEDWATPETGLRSQPATPAESHCAMGGRRPNERRLQAVSPFLEPLKTRLALAPAPRTELMSLVQVAL